MPRDLSAQWSGFTSVSLNWRAPEMVYGGIIGYRVTYRPASSNQSQVLEILASDNPALRIGGLGPFTEYIFMVYTYVHVHMHVFYNLSVVLINFGDAGSC